MQTESAAKLIAACEAMGLEDVTISTFDEGKKVSEYVRLQVTRIELQALRKSDDVLVTHEWYSRYLADDVQERYGVYIGLV